MTLSISALEIKEFGQPSEVVYEVRKTLAPLATNQILIRMLAAPIDPADINICEGKYAIRPDCPFTPGHAGVGMVQNSGVAVAGFKPGQKVILPNFVGTWAEQIIVEAHQVFPLPPGLSDVQACLMSVNPATAFRLLNDFRKVSYDEWIIQNAANSSLGHNIIQLAHAKGYRSVNIVRSAEHIEPLKAQGADVVIVDGPEAKQQIKAATENAPINLGFNFTGGPQLKTLASCLSDGAHMVTCGAMSKQPFTLSNAHLIFRGLVCTGFWISNYYNKANDIETTEMFAELGQLIRKGVIQSPIEETYLLRDCKKALEHAQREGRKGKVLFTF